ncbi:type VII secretion integral membrane protein EccD [Streptomyces sp. NPDC051561]|uniref:type VII secretion integral membrane protein EccD n=1 Tax=Streptomyces sp. NPDC051561 TaxID=3365658 RepID=UPI0037B0BE69
MPPHQTTTPTPAAGQAPTNTNNSAAGQAPTSTPYLRLTLTTPTTRIDLALPSDLPLADLHPELLRLSGHHAPHPHTSQPHPHTNPTHPHTPIGHHLVRRDGTILNSSRTLAAQRVLDGEILAMRPFAESLAPPVFDDISDAVASTVARDRTLWSDHLTRTTGLSATSALLTLLALTLWNAHPLHHTRGLPGTLAALTAVLLLALAATRARVYDDQGSALALGAPALAHAAVAGTAFLPLAPGAGPGRLHALLALAAVLLASVLLLIASPNRTGTPTPPATAPSHTTPSHPTDAPFVATATASTAGLLLLFAATVTGLTPTRAAALGVPLLVGALAFLPSLAARFARIPVGFAAPPTPASGGYVTDPEPDSPQPPVDAVRIAARTRRGHELLTGLVGGCALLAVACAAVLGFSGGVRAQLLALALGAALLLRAHLFRYTAQAGCVLAAGLGTLLLLGLGMALRPPPALTAAALAGHTGPLDLRTIGVTAVTAAVAAVLAAIALIVPKKGVTPFWGRFLELADTCVLLLPVPLCLAVFDAYHALRAAGP